MGVDDFYIMPLPNCDVLMGIPWHYDKKALINVVEKTITITHKGKRKVLTVSTKGDLVPIVSASAITSIMKHHISTYLIFVKDNLPDIDVKSLT